MYATSNIRRLGRFYAHPTTCPRKISQGIVEAILSARLRPHHKKQVQAAREFLASTIGSSQANAIGKQLAEELIPLYLPQFIKWKAYAPGWQLEDWEGIFPDIEAIRQQSTDGQGKHTKTILWVQDARNPSDHGAQSWPVFTHQMIESTPEGREGVARYRFYIRLKGKGIWSKLWEYTPE